MENDKIQLYKNKLMVSDLIFDVLTDKKTVLEAINLFPKDKNDINIKCAFDALIYREADEDLRKKDFDYALLQDEYLELIAQTLKNDQNLPKNVIQRYLEYNKDNLIYKPEKTFKEKLEKLKRMINF